MQETSNLYKQILSDISHVKQWRVLIDGARYSEDYIVSASITRSLYGNDIIGGTYSASLSLVLKGIPSSDIAKMAKIKIEVRLCHSVNGSEEVSEWIPKGTFWINTRSENKIDGQITLNCVDAMMFGEQMFYDEESVIPYWNNEPMRSVAEMCAEKMGIELEDATQFQNETPYLVTSPPIGWTVRQVLSGIAVSHCGNIIVTEDNKLRLVPLYSIPEETNLLITEDGDNIMFGGDRIVV